MDSVGVCPSDIFFPVHSKYYFEYILLNAVLLVVQLKGLPYCELCVVSQKLHVNSIIVYIWDIVYMFQ